MAPTATSSRLFRVKVTLKGIKPPIWRRLLIQDTASLSDLHEAIQVVIGWTGYHLYQFDICGGYYGNPKMVEGVSSDARMKLANLFKDGVRRFTYTYDFGDDWDHTVFIECDQPKLDGQFYPLCVGGNRNGPPEDCGGPWGYQELLDILANPDHPEHEERSEWLGGREIHPEMFDLNGINAKLCDRFTKTGKARPNPARLVMEQG